MKLKFQKYKTLKEYRSASSKENELAYYISAHHLYFKINSEKSYFKIKKSDSFKTDDNVRQFILKKQKKLRSNTMNGSITIVLILAAITAACFPAGYIALGLFGAITLVGFLVGAYLTYKENQLVNQLEQGEEEPEKLEKQEELPTSNLNPLLPIISASPSVESRKTLDENEVKNSSEPRKTLDKTEVENSSSKSEVLYKSLTEKWEKYCPIVISNSRELDRRLNLRIYGSVHRVIQDELSNDFVLSGLKRAFNAFDKFIKENSQYKDQKEVKEIYTAFEDLVKIKKEYRENKASLYEIYQNKTIAKSQANSSLSDEHARIQSYAF